jgi:beta-lactamase superfamily II metal-dependent hydrolase
MSNGYQGFEVDILPVGTGARSGDAIAMRVGAPEANEIVVVDGGNLEAGEALVDHINIHFGNPTHIHHVICTHPDNDHTSGLRKLLENFTIGTLWIHQPWLHAAEIVDSFKGKWTTEGLEKHLRTDCFPIVAELCETAEKGGTTLAEPFQGQPIGAFVVLAPTYQRYLTLLPDMERTPAQKGILESAFDMLKSAAETVYSALESWNVETLKEPATDANSPSNESSVVMFGNFPKRRILLTGDAGVSALQQAYDYAQAVGYNIISPDFIQIPHHGGRRNVSPAILDKILGDRLPDETSTRGWAVASASKDDPHHPRRVVLNAFKRRGYKCTSTEGNNVNYRSNFPNRSGYSAISPFGLFAQVEE